jgi:hypothetical protein
MDLIRMENSDKIDLLKWQMGQLAYDLYQEEEVIVGYDEHGPIVLTRKELNEWKKSVTDTVQNFTQEVSGGIAIKGEIEYGKIQSKRFTFPK